MVYLTYNDPPSGIYFSQVTNVCEFYIKTLNKNIRLVSLISVRNFLKNRKKIKANFNEAIVLPMFPGPRNWRLNIFLLTALFFLIRPQRIIARGPFATCLSLWIRSIRLTKFICFDARGAYTAEHQEYNVSSNSKLSESVFLIEKKAIIDSDFRIAVSQKLVSYWKEKFDYSSTMHVVIPCTYNSNIFNMPPNEHQIIVRRKELKFAEEDIVLVYSGSISGWQSMKLLDDYLISILNSNLKVKILLLLKSIVTDLNVVTLFSDRVILMNVDEKRVPLLLQCCDYGLLIREKSVTNHVASPVKFAEYLYSGLKVIVSDQVGDYSEFVQTHDCGVVVNSHPSTLAARTFSERLVLNKLSVNLLSKDKFKMEYEKINSND